jgi:hypothetical protein
VTRISVRVDWRGILRLGSEMGLVCYMCPPVAMPLSELPFLGRGLCACTALLNLPVAYFVARCIYSCSCSCSFRLCPPLINYEIGIKTGARMLYVSPRGSVPASEIDCPSNSTAGFHCSSASSSQLHPPLLLMVVQKYHQNPVIHRTQLILTPSCCVYSSPSIDFCC